MKNLTMDVQMTTKDQQIENQIIDYYDNAGPDYAFWSKKFNMHFGYYKKGMNPLTLEPMLDAMNDVILENLRLSSEDQHICDLGCGLGTTARHIASKNKRIRITGFSIVQNQIKEALNRTKANNLNHQVNFIQADYRDLPLASNSIDGAYALESACHCPGKTKLGFIRELSRALKPGKNFVIIDGFLRKKEEKMTLPAKYIYQRMCKGWAVPKLANIDEFVKNLNREGLMHVKVENLFWKIAPSVLHVPKTLFKFCASLLTNQNPITKEQIRNAEASFMGMLLGMHTRTFGYYKITGTKMA